MIIMDDYHREMIVIEVRLSFPSERVVRVFQRLELEWSLSQRIRVGKGLEFLAKNLRCYHEKKIEIN